MESRKEQIIQVALKRFAHYGFHKTTMSEIAVDLNITKANLYYYYPDKDALIKDVLSHLLQEIKTAEFALVAEYDHNVLDILCRLLQLRADFIRTYYVLHISESLEWLKGQGVGSILEEMRRKDVEVIKWLFDKAVQSGELILEDREASALSLIQIIKGVGLTCSVADIISGIPTPHKVDDILESQKRAIRFIFANKLNKSI